MPKEIHYYLFSPEELHVALMQFQRARAEKIPTDAIATVQLSHGPAGVSAIMTAAGSSDPAAPKFSIEYGQDQLLGAIVLFCKSQRIPLAVRADKRVELAGDKLALVATMNAERGQPENRDGTISYTDKDIEARRRTLRSD